MQVHGTALQTSGTLRRVGIETPGPRLRFERIATMARTTTKIAKELGPLRLAGTEATKTRNKRWGVQEVWTKKLGKRFTPVSSYFIENYHRLPDPINANEILLLIHLLKYKWVFL